MFIIPNDVPFVPKIEEIQKLIEGNLGIASSIENGYKSKITNNIPTPSNITEGLHGNRPVTDNSANQLGLLENDSELEKNNYTEQVNIVNKIQSAKSGLKAAEETIISTMIDSQKPTIELAILILDLLKPLEITYDMLLGGVNPLYIPFSYNGKANQSIIQNREVFYTGVEAYPVTENILNALNYSEILDKDNSDNYFQILHQIPWEEFRKVNTGFHLCKRQQFFDEIDDEESFDLIYFDAFGFRVQPELWGEEIFKKMYKALKKKGVLVTYACRTPIKKAMEASGFITEKLSGPPGKREMLRAVKLG
jgi:hypothetical protein